ncbi:MAG: hypothetical protein ABFD64_08310 [Armatimonadota bacterium]
MKFTPKLTRISSNKYGVLKLRDLNLNDAIYIEELTANKIATRDFTAKLLYHQMESPNFSEECVNSWPDKLLLRVAGKWLQESLKVDPSATTQFSFEQFNDNVTGYLEEQKRRFIEAASAPAINNVVVPATAELLLKLESLRVSARPLLVELMAQLADVSRSIANTIVPICRKMVDEVKPAAFRIGTSDLISRIPDLSNIDKRLDQAKVIFRKEGYEFAIYDMPIRDICRLAESMPKTRSAIVTNKMLSLTRSNAFEALCSRIFTSSKILKPRWKIVQQTLIAHKNRQYEVSIPTLLSQIEGVITDIVILSNVAFAERGKVYEMEDGKPKLNKKGENIELRGLDSKVRCSKLRKDPMLDATVEILTNSLISERNGILHGTNKSYGKPKLSTQALMIVAILAAEIEYFEKGRKESNSLSA